jgi:hypothetical protein
MQMYSQMLYRQARGHPYNGLVSHHPAECNEKGHNTSDEKNAEA